MGSADRIFRILQIAPEIQLRVATCHWQGKERLSVRFFSMRKDAKGEPFYVPSKTGVELGIQWLDALLETLMDIRQDRYGNPLPGEGAPLPDVQLEVEAAGVAFDVRQEERESRRIAREALIRERARAARAAKAAQRGREQLQS